MAHPFQVDAIIPTIGNHHTFHSNREASTLFNSIHTAIDRSGDTKMMMRIEEEREWNQERKVGVQGTSALSLSLYIYSAYICRQSSMCMPLPNTPLTATSRFCSFFGDAMSSLPPPISKMSRNMGTCCCCLPSVRNASSIAVVDAFHNPVTCRQQALISPAPPIHLSDVASETDRPVPYLLCTATGMAMAPTSLLSITVQNAKCKWKRRVPPSPVGGNV